MRNLLTSKIEEDWKNLEMREKQRMTELYNRVMKQSDMQDELKMAAAFREAIGKQQKYLVSYDD